VKSKNDKLLRTKNLISDIQNKVSQPDKEKPLQRKDTTTNEKHDTSDTILNQQNNNNANTRDNSLNNRDKDKLSKETESVKDNEQNDAHISRVASQQQRLGSTWIAIFNTPTRSKCDNTKAVGKLGMFDLIQGLGQNISNHFLGWTIHRLDLVGNSVSTNKVMANVNVLGAVVVDRILCQRKTSLVVLMDDGGRVLAISKF
jgi:hypothetical protein